MNAPRNPYMIRYSIRMPHPETRELQEPVVTVREFPTEEARAFFRAFLCECDASGQWSLCDLQTYEVGITRKLPEPLTPWAEMARCFDMVRLNVPLRDPRYS